MSATQNESVGMSAHAFIYPSIHLFTVHIPYGIVENVINPNEFALYRDWSFLRFPEDRERGGRGRKGRREKKTVRAEDVVNKVRTGQ